MFIFQLFHLELAELKKLAQRFVRSDCEGDADTYLRRALRERLRRLPQIG